MVIVVLSLVSYLSFLGVNLNEKTFESQYNYYFEIEKKKKRGNEAEAT